MTDAYTGKTHELRFQEGIARYLKFLEAHPAGDEIQYRTPFENLLNAVTLPERRFSIISTLENGFISRKQKLAFLEKSTFTSARWKKFKPAAPHFWFVKKNIKRQGFP